MTNASVQFLLCFVVLCPLDSQTTSRLFCRFRSTRNKTMVPGARGGADDSCSAHENGADCVSNMQLTAAKRPLALLTYPRPLPHAAKT